jgi:hypothetical protein
MALTSLDIVLRTCTTTNVNNSGWRRWLDVSKPTLVERCVRSLVASINQIDPGIHVHLLVLDDDLAANVMVQQQLAPLRCTWSVEHLGGVGHNASALRQFQACRHSDADFVYAVEDDYLHEPLALSTMIHDHVLFEQRLHNAVAIHPFDDPFCYWHADKMCSSRVVAGVNRHYRTNTFSTYTIFSTPYLFRQHWNKWETLATRYGVDDTTEHTTINTLWNNGVDRHGDVYLFTPIPSLATHISYNNKPLFYDTLALWDSYA